MTGFLAFTVVGVATGAIYALTASGLVVTYQTTGIFNFAHGAIGMLVAFQMFATRVSQPLLRLVGLWQQFQQARLSVERLGDIMNAPAEPYSLVPGRVCAGRGLIEIEDLSFRYADNLPLLLKDLPPARAAAIAAQLSGVPRRAAYEQALQLAGGR